MLYSIQYLYLYVSYPVPYFIIIPYYVFYVFMYHINDFNVHCINII